MAMRDICEVKVGIPLGNMDPAQITVNQSYAMNIEPPASSTSRGGEQGQMLTGTLQVRRARLLSGLK